MRKSAEIINTDNHKVNLADMLKIVTELGKMKITFFVAISAAVGFVSAAGGFSPELFILSFGVFVLSSGSAAFNHFQEKSTDALMDRTKNRPLPSGQISPDIAFAIAAALSIIGLLIILTVSNIAAMLLGVMALVWYNLIYTPLKKKTPWAIMPGALVGAIPPAIGWAAAGGGLADPRMLAIALFFFIWQIPHFWFLLLIFDKDYIKAGFPTLTQQFNREQIMRMSYAWVAALVASGALIPFFGVTENLWAAVVIMIAGFALIWRTRLLVSKFEDFRKFKIAFLDINIYVLLTVIILSVDHLF
jgi:protoheme IX farnesyltransferase